jgi:hypothetical protein
VMKWYKREVVSLKAGAMRRVSEIIIRLDHDQVSETFCRRYGKRPSRAIFYSMSGRMYTSTHLGKDTRLLLIAIVSPYTMRHMS